MSKIKVTLPGNNEMLVSYKTKVGDLIREVESADKIKDIFAFKINNEVKTYDAELFEDSNIEYVKYDSEDGYRIYLRGLKFVIYIALKQMDPNIVLSIPHSLYGSYYCKLDGINITEELITKIKEKMNNIIMSDLKFERRVVQAQEAEVLYRESGDLEKVQMLEDKIKSYSTMYFCNDIYNYFYGAMVPSSGYIKSFDIKPYMDGFVLIMPNSGNINEVLEFKKSKKVFETFEEYERLNKDLGIENIGSLNKAVKEDRISEVIRINDAIQDRKIVQMALDIKEKKDIKMVLIAGPSSSGKTTTAQKLALQLRLNGQKPIVVSMDNYFVDREESYVGEDGKYDFESIKSLDLKLFNHQMNNLIAGQEIDIPVFNFVTGHKEYMGNKIKLGDDGIVIIEGIHGLNESMTEFIPRNRKYKIFVSALTTLNMDRYTRVSTLDTRLIRRIIRDSEFRGHGVEKTLQMWESVRRGEEKYIFPFQEEADFVYNTSMTYEMGVFKTYAQPILMQVGCDKKEYSEARRLYEFLNNFLSIETTEIAIDSTIREFIGGGCFYR